MFSQFPFILAQEAASLTILDRISPHDLLPIIVVTVSLVFGSIIAVSAIVLGNWRKVRDRKIVASLIQDMLDRNMSSVEIEQVMTRSVKRQWRVLLAQRSPVRPFAAEASETGQVRLAPPSPSHQLVNSTP